MSTAASAVSSTRQASRPSFYLVMTLVMAFFVFAGFGMTYWIPLASGTFPPAPPVVHLHGLVFSTWMILLVVQATLINFGRVSAHRSLGTYGIAHATAVLFTGALISVLGWRDLNSLPAELPPDISFDTLYLSFTAVIGFGLLFTLAIRNVRNPEVHKRLMLFAILPILPPGVNRFYMVPLGIDTIPVAHLYVTLNAMSLAILIQEWRVNGRVAGTSMIGAGYMLLQTMLHVPVSGSQTLLKLSQYIGNLVYYR